MADVMGAVLKKDRVRMTQAPPPAGPPTSSAAPGARMHTPLARIVRESRCETLIEVGCSCGRRTLVRCQYPALPDGVAGTASPTPLQGEDTCVV